MSYLKAKKPHFQAKLKKTTKPDNCSINNVDALMEQAEQRGWKQYVTLVIILMTRFSVVVTVTSANPNNTRGSGAVRSGVL